MGRDDDVRPLRSLCARADLLEVCGLRRVMCRVGENVQGRERTSMVGGQKTTFVTKSRRRRLHRVEEFGCLRERCCSFE